MPEKHARRNGTERSAEEIALHIDELLKLCRFISIDAGLHETQPHQLGGVIRAETAQKDL